MRKAIFATFLLVFVSTNAIGQIVSAAIRLGEVAQDSVRLQIHHPSAIIQNLKNFESVLALMPQSSAITAITQATDEFIVQVNMWPELSLSDAETRQKSLGKDPAFSKWAKAMQDFKNNQ